MLLKLFWKRECSVQKRAWWFPRCSRNHTTLLFVIFFSQCRKWSLMVNVYPIFLQFKCCIIVILWSGKGISQYKPELRSQFCWLISEEQKKRPPTWVFPFPSFFLCQNHFEYFKNINSFNPHNKQPLEVRAFIISIFTDEKNCKQFAWGHITHKRWSSVSFQAVWLQSPHFEAHYSMSNDPYFQGLFSRANEVISKGKPQ